MENTSDFNVTETLNKFVITYPDKLLQEINVQNVLDTDIMIPDDFDLNASSPEALSPLTSQTVSPSHTASSSEAPSTSTALPFAEAASQSSSGSSEASAPGSSQELLQTAPREQALTTHVAISVQPEKYCRFRYESELQHNRSTGVIPGCNSTPELPTYPTIRLYNYCGHASRLPVVVVSCVTHEEPYIEHPNQLFGGNEKTRVVGGMAVAEFENVTCSAFWQVARAKRVRTVGAGSAHSSSEEEHSTDDESDCEPDQNELDIEKYFGKMTL